MLTLDDGGLELRSRGRSELGGAWMGDARFRTGRDRPPTDRITLQLGPHGGGGAADEIEEQAEPGRSAVVEFVLLLAACSVHAAEARVVMGSLGRRRRGLALASQHHPRLLQLARELRAQLDEYSPGLAYRISELLERFPRYAEVTGLQLRQIGGELPWLKHDEDFQGERKDVQYHYITRWDALEHTLNSGPFAAAIADMRLQETQWRVLGYASRTDYAEYLQPTMRSLTESPGELGEDVLERLLGDGSVNVSALAREGVPESITVDLLNRLITDGWATTPDETDDLKLTTSGARLLRKRLERWRQPGV